jgi:anti-sigma B factor antagonist
MTAPLWSYRHSHDRRIRTVHLSGELDLVVADDLGALLLAQFAQPETDAVVADLTEVGFMDSAALGALLLAYQHASDHGGRFTVTGATGGVARVLEITGVAGLLSGTAEGVQ